ncbi:SRPBCC family protein [Flagellimonas allohymeniacidonis]|uniref:SRPBCC domain-containing protein n=1 Tax=Flagellimonas allohymeniacidonis TaxID=2517819 RepID=A0A4Q8Q8T6_9FLAO|nr:SRPBCC domain-containing protein [Allomuricauda hymeniacidonis]TAI46642.1 SRPBCC domain-containing protein [Allomuricauda hymeniacidonis]
MNKLTFDQFTKKIYIKAPLEKLYWCWGTSEGICSWFLRKADYTKKDGTLRKSDENIQKGDLYTWEWHNWDGQAQGEVLEANGNNHLTISFEDSHVSVSLEESKNAVLVILKQFNIPTDDESKLNIHHGCSNGWTFWLANLKAYLEHGVLLNETEFDLTNIPLAGFEFVNM